MAGLVDLFVEPNYEVVLNAAWLSLKQRKALAREAIEQLRASSTTQSATSTVVAPPPPPLTRTQTAGAPLEYSNAGYGGAIPIVFGADKLTGNVVWASPVTTHNVPVNNQYVTYQSIDFAVALCEGPVAGVTRIWIGDNLVYDRTMEVDGSNIPVTRTGRLDNTVIDVVDASSPLAAIPSSDRATEIDIFVGNETQVAHSAMADQEGYINTPAYRGICYVLFKNFVTSGTGVPNLFFEVVANTDQNFPRQQFTNSGLPECNSALIDFGVRPLLGWRKYLIQGNRSTDNEVGYFLIDLDTFDEFQNLTFQSAGASLGTATERFPVVLRNGLFAFHGNDGNAGYIKILNPFSGVMTAEIGDGGIFHISNPDETGAPGLPHCYTTQRFFNIEGSFSDYILISGTGASCTIGIYGVDPTGTTVSYGDHQAFTTVFDGMRYAKLYPFEVSEALYNQYPTFADGTSSYGNWVFVAAFLNSLNPGSTGTSVGRLIYAPPTDGDWADFNTFELQAARHRLIAASEIHGENEIAQVVAHIWLEREGCFLLFWEGSGQDTILKYNVFTDEIEWKISQANNNFVSTFGSYPDGMPIGDLSQGERYCWIDGFNNIRCVDIADGSYYTVTTTTDQSIPAASSGKQFYSGPEDSIAYLGAGTLNKVFLSRITTTVTSLPLIVKSLLERVNIQAADLNLNDISALSLRGYTVREVKPLREVFNSLRQVYTFEMIESGGRIKYISRGATSVETVPNTWLANMDEPGSYIKETNETDLANLRKIDLTYSDVDREYGSSVQNIYYPRAADAVGVDNDAAIQLNTPVVLNADEARYLADKLLYARRLNERKLTFVLPFRYAYLDPADTITVTVDETESIVCRITRLTITKEFHCEVEAVVDDPDIYNDDPSIGGTFGRFYKVKFRQQGALFQPYIIKTPWDTWTNPAIIPLANQGYAQHIVIYCLLDYTQVNETPIDNTIRVTVQSDTQPDYLTTADVPASGITKEVPSWGFVTSVPANPPTAFTVQPENSLTIRVMNDRADFPFATSPLSFTSGEFWTTNTNQGWSGNLISVGEELIRFHTVTDNMDGTYTLTGLIRACNNTVHAYEDNKLGQPCVLLYNVNGILDSLAFQNISLTAMFSLGPTDWQMVLGDFYESYEILAANSNPYSFPATLGTTSWDMIVPNPWNIKIDKDGSNEYIVTWNRASRFVSVRSGTTEPAYEEWYDDGDDADQPLMRDDTPDHFVYISDSPLREDGGTTDLSDPATYLRKTNVTGTLTWTYTAALQSTDGFTHTSDTLYVWVVTNAFFGGEVWRKPKTYSYAP